MKLKYSGFSTHLMKKNINAISFTQSSVLQMVLRIDILSLININLLQKCNTYMIPTKYVPVHQTLLNKAEYISPAFPT